MKPILEYLFFIAGSVCFMIGSLIAIAKVKGWV